MKEWQMDASAWDEARLARNLLLTLGPLFQD
jgi:hypothetical protein